MRGMAELPLFRTLLLGRASWLSSPAVLSLNRATSESPTLSRMVSPRLLRSRASCCAHHTSPADDTRKPPAEARAMTRRRIAASMSSRATCRDCRGSRQPPPIMRRPCSSRVSRRLRKTSYSTRGTYAYLVATTRFLSSHRTLVMHTSRVMGRTPRPNAVSPANAVYASTSITHDAHIPKQQMNCSVQKTTAVGPPPREARSGTTKMRLLTAIRTPPSSAAINGTDSGKN